MRSSSGRNTQPAGAVLARALAQRGDCYAEDGCQHLTSPLPSCVLIVPTSPASLACQLFLIPQRGVLDPTEQGLGTLDCLSRCLCPTGDRLAVLWGWWHWEALGGAQQQARAWSAVDSHPPILIPRESDELRRTRLNSRTNGVLKSTLLMSGWLSRSKMMVF